MILLMKISCPLVVNFLQARIQYNYVNDPKSFSDAQTFCQTQYGGSLASIVSATENTQVLGLLTSTRAWIGLHRQADVAAGFVDPVNWAWVDGSVYTHNDGTSSFWANGEPNNTGDSENCTTMYSQTDRNTENVNGGFPAGTWNDDNCATARPFVCGTLVC
jgi:hypothetical protein